MNPIYRFAFAFAFTFAASLLAGAAHAQIGVSDAWVLLDLPRQVKEGETIPLSLVLEGSDGRRETVEVQAAVRPLAATPTH